MKKINKIKIIVNGKISRIKVNLRLLTYVKELKIPFRKSHEISGRIVKLAEKNNCLLHELPLDSFKSIEKKINNNIFKVLSVENSVKSKISYGGTSPKEVLKQIKNAKRRFLK